MPKPIVSKQIIKNQEIINDDWVLLADDAALAGDKIIVSVARWLAEKDALQTFKGKLGILIEFDRHIDEVESDLDTFELVAIEFQAYTDGRGYSYATLLRRNGWKKEIRAIGDVQRDQVFYMHRCGFDAFDIREDTDINDALKAFDDFTIAYQPAINNPA